MTSARLPAAPEDLTGRDRMTWNVLSSWGGYLVFIAGGFVLPRLIDHHVGQTALGVWDFGWSVVSYIGLAQIGVGSSVNRYVARHRALNDVEGLRRVVSSVMCVQVVTALLLAAVTAATAWALPVFLQDRLGSDTAVASSVVALLGAALVIQTALDAFRGVITGCHRWDLHNTLNAAFYGLTAGGMIVALVLGGGLPTLGFVNLAGVALAEVTRVAIAYRVCPELRVGLTWARWSEARRVLVFGLKSSLTGMSRLLLLQANSILVASHLGMGALAVYARPGGLMRHTETFANKFALVLTPTASSLQGSGREGELRELLIGSVRYGAYLVLPITLTLALLGDVVLRLWMGPRYEQGPVICILALGYLLPLAQQPVLTILTGLNLHGRAALISLAAAVCGVGLSLVTVRLLGWGLVGAALAVALPLTLGNGVVIPLYACRRLAIPVGAYFRRAFLGPLATAVPFAACLVAIRLLLRERPLLAMGSAGVAGALVLGPLYWRYVIPPALRDKVVGLVGRRLSRGALGGEVAESRSTSRSWP